MADAKEKFATRIAVAQDGRLCWAFAALVKHKCLTVKIIKGLMSRLVAFEAGSLALCVEILRANCEMRRACEAKLLEKKKNLFGKLAKTYESKVSELWIGLVKNRDDYDEGLGLIAKKMGGDNYGMMKDGFRLLIENKDYWANRDLDADFLARKKKEILLKMIAGHFGKLDSALGKLNFRNFANKTSLNKLCMRFLSWSYNMKIISLSILKRRNTQVIQQQEAAKLQTKTKQNLFNRIALKQSQKTEIAFQKILKNWSNLKTKTKTLCNRFLNTSDNLVARAYGHLSANSRNFEFLKNKETKLLQKLIKAQKAKSEITFERLGLNADADFNMNKSRLKRKQETLRRLATAQFSKLNACFALLIKKNIAYRVAIKKTCTGLVCGAFAVVGDTWWKLKLHKISIDREEEARRLFSVKTKFF